MMAASTRPVRWKQRRWRSPIEPTPTTRIRGTVAAITGLSQAVVEGEPQRGEAALDLLQAGLDEDDVRPVADEPRPQVHQLPGPLDRPARHAPVLAGRTGGV